MAAKPTYLSKIPRNTDVSAAHVGTQMLGLGLYRQGLQVASVLSATNSKGFPLYPTVGVMLPRRSTKTTSIWSVILGRCSTIPGYKAVVTAQDGQRARNRMREVMRHLAAIGFEENGEGKLEWSNGSETIRFTNGSAIWVVAPSAGSFRGEAADCLLFDEAGELSADKSEDLLSGALPLLDTRPMGQAIIAGTPAKTRAGLLWDVLQEGRQNVKGTGIVEYSIRDDEASVLIDQDGNVELNRAVLKRVHPGIGTLTTLAKIEANYSRMQLPQFEREYLCRFPMDNATSAIGPEEWTASRVDTVERGARVGIAFDCAYDGTSASIAYAWRDQDGNAYGEIVAHRMGTSWVAREAHKASEKNRRTAVAFDDIGANRDPATALQRLKPTPRTERLSMKDIMGAAQRLVSDIHEGRFRHFGQVDLDAAVANTTWRDIQRSGRAFGSKVANGASINPVVAISLALWSYDKGRDRQPITIVTG